MHKNVIIIVFAISFILNTAYAEKVMPEFTGEWFEDILEFNADSCFMPHLYYKNKLNDKNALINKAFENLPSINNCQWEKPYFSYKDGEPDGFLTDNFDEIIQHNPNTPQREYWKSDCKDIKGNIVESTIRVISPLYDCPKGSRITWNTNGISFCSTTPLICIADVVGRNLNSNHSTLGYFGHVGLTTFESGQPLGNYVLEVLDNDTVINVNSLKDFINTVPGFYWGEVYGLKTLSFIDLMKAAYAIQTGLSQRKFEPKYTPGIFWREGRYKLMQIYDGSSLADEKNIVPALFRCDTFVNYCYFKAFDVTIPTLPNINILPTSTFNSFLYKRTDVSEAPQNNAKHLLAPFSLESNFDSQMISYLNDSKISRHKKLNDLWERSKSKDFNEFAYMIDTLRGLHPNEKIPEFIHFYNKEKDVKRKLRLISVIADATIDDQIINSTNKNKIANTILAQAFISNVLKTENNTKILHDCIWESMHALPKNRENYFIISNAIKRLQASSNKNQRLESNEKYLLIFSMAFANNDMQKWLLPTLLSAAINSDEKIAFNKELFFIIQQMEPAEITQETKVQIKKYIDSLSIETNNANFDQLHALATVTSDTIELRNKILLDYALTSKSSSLKAELINYIDEQSLLLLSNEQRKELRYKFFNLFKKANNFKDKTSYAIAMKKMGESS